MPFTYEYARPALSVDCVVFRGDEILLVERAREPFASHWALPGGFLDVGEELCAGAMRELKEETGLAGIELQQVGAFGDPSRDPREHVVSVAFWGEAPLSAKVVAGDDARLAAWWRLGETPRLAFDHAEILEAALERRKR